MRAAPLSQPIAFLSDIHGNLPALEAVLEDLAPRGIAQCFVAGNLLLGGEQPLQVWRRLQGLAARCTAGPSDRALATVAAAQLRPKDAAEQARADRFRQTQAELGEVVLHQLRELPATLRLPMLDGRELLMVHGSPADPLTSIGHEMEDEEILLLLADDAADIVVCGGTHVPFQRQVGDLWVVNVGSVGEAAGGGHAQYTVITPKASGADIEQNWVDLVSYAAKSVGTRPALRTNSRDDAT